jgi:hypothetical protein
MIINIMVFSYTNGYACSISFFYATQQAEPRYIGKAGSTISLFINIGIYAGSLFAIIAMQGFA